MNEYSRVVDWVDIQAPREEVFSLITDIDRRMQLSPLWGIAAIESRPADYPQVGSTYLVRHRPADPATQTSAGEPPLLVEPKAAHTEPIAYQSVVTAYEPPYKFAYCLDVDQQTSVTWNLSESAAGTRLTYTEEYLVDDVQAEAFNTQVRAIVKNWLKNIKTYSELRNSRFKRSIRWVLDRFFLKMPPEQRKVIAIILVMHATGFIAFLMAALAMGIASLFF